jgi:hypothetical protein
MFKIYTLYGCYGYKKIRGNEVKLHFIGLRIPKKREKKIETYPVTIINP